MADQLHRFLIANAGIRGEWIELDSQWQQVGQRHELNDDCTRLLGELTAASLLLSATIKHSGSLTAQVIGDGPVNLAVVQCRADGSYRATMKLSESRPLPQSPSQGIQPLVNPGGKGRFAITIDPQETGGNTYQGIVPLEGDSVARVLERYMFRSEQLPTRLWLAANADRVCGLLLQKMPMGAAGPYPDGDGWNRLQKLADTLQTDEMLDIDGPTALRRLFWQEQLEQVQRGTIRFACQCTRQRVADMLRMLGEAEVDSIIREQGQVLVNCEYCNSPYVFDPVDCAALFAQGSMPGNSTRQ